VYRLLIILYSYTSKLKLHSVFKETTVYTVHLVFVVIMMMLLLLLFQEGLIQSPRKLLNEVVVVFDVIKYCKYYGQSGCVRFNKVILFLVSE